MKRNILLLFAFTSALVNAQTVTVKDTTLRTYPFSDPNPIAKTDRVYPYLRYSGFALSHEEKSWKMVVLENDYLRVKIFPEIGGKIWSVYDKINRKELFYDNDVVKFRDISLRGPWTSGGIEFNYGVIGHAPSCSHPVDYKTTINPDGSVSCFIGVSELLARSRWVVEINLPKEAMWVRTRSFWHNGSGEYQPYYTWANSAVKAGSDLVLVYPAEYTIGHNGQTSPYPVEGPHDLSRYDGQRFGQDHSFHPGGSHKSFFGAYWQDEDYGMLHYALRDEKAGRKYFSWAQSRQGEIWVDLLTDKGSQYVEMQSGRLFNQNDTNSVHTPYKQILFTPFGTDEWNEYWLPFSGIGGVDDMSLQAVVNVNSDSDGIHVGICPLVPISGLLGFKDDKGNTLFSQKVLLSPGKSLRLDRKIAGKLARIELDSGELWSADSQITDRPKSIDKDFNSESADGLSLHALYYYGMKEYRKSEKLVDKALLIEPSCVDALNIKAMILKRRLDYNTAYAYCNRVLSIDTYNPMANYNSGLIALSLGKYYDAMDRFEVASITPELRSAAQTQLAILHFRRGNPKLAEEYAKKALIGNGHNITALEVLSQTCRPEKPVLEMIEKLDPLCHFPDIERMLDGIITPKELDASIFEEMKIQNYYEYASFYHNLGLNDKSLALLDAAPEKSILTELWKAWLKGDVSAISVAEKAPLDFVFPFRELSAEVLQWALDNGASWKVKYLLAMLKASFGDEKAAEMLMEDNDNTYAPFYAFRATLTGDLKDYARAFELDGDEWRYRDNLARRYYDNGDYDKAIELTEKYYLRHRDNYHIGETCIKALVAAGKYRKAEKYLKTIRILPFEGQSDIHNLYKEVKIKLGKESEAGLWPENLGVGRPYDADAVTP